jgi:type I restriction enzyme, S subunit
LAHQNGAGAVPGVNRNALHLLPVRVPPLPIQHKIADILTAYDNLIENNTRRIAILEETAQMLYQEWFVKFHFPGYEQVKMMESELGMVPEGWKVTELSSLVTTQYGYTESATEVPVGPRYLRGMDINKKSYVQWEDVPFCTIDESNYPKYKLRTGDILVIRMADPGKVGIVEKNIEAVFASYLIRLRILSRSITPYYLFYFLLSDRYQNYINGAHTGATRKSASAGVITDIKIIVPPADIQEYFEKHISLLRLTFNSLLDKNANLRRTRDMLLPKLISGEIDVASWVEGDVVEEMVEASVAGTMGVYSAVSEVRKVAEAGVVEPIKVDELEWRSLWE